MDPLGGLRWQIQLMMGHFDGLVWWIPMSDPAVYYTFDGSLW